jgi:mannose-6-phosphate isomerase-like protein (cupin superfamily)
MQITRLNEAQTYQAPNHDGMTCFRLQGKEAGPSEKMWMGMSVIEPGGHTGLDGSPSEKIYFVLEGELTVLCETLDGRRLEVKLYANDSCTFLAGEKRQLKNLSSSVVKVLLVMSISI